MHVCIKNKTCSLCIENKTWSPTIYSCYKRCASGNLSISSLSDYLINLEAGPKFICIEFGFNLFIFKMKSWCEGIFYGNASSNLYRILSIYRTFLKQHSQYPITWRKTPTNPGISSFLQATIVFAVHLVSTRLYLIQRTFVNNQCWQHRNHSIMWTSAFDSVNQMLKST